MNTALKSMMDMAPPDEGSAPEVQSTEQTPKPKDSPNCIQAPKGLKTPDGDAEGEAFDGIFRGKIKDGKLYFDSINNIPVEGSDEETPEEENTETPDEESGKQDAGTEKPMDSADKAYAKKQSEDSAFKKAFH